MSFPARTRAAWNAADVDYIAQLPEEVVAALQLVEIFIGYSTNSARWTFYAEDEIQRPTVLTYVRGLSHSSEDWMAAIARAVSHRSAGIKHGYLRNWPARHNRSKEAV